MTRRASSLCGEFSPRDIAWEWDSVHDTYLASLGSLQTSASVCASEKGKPVVRRGRSAYGPPDSYEVAGLSNGGGATKLRPQTQRREGCGCSNQGKTNGTASGLSRTTVRCARR